MTAARPKFAWTPLTMTYAEAADVAFRKSENWLREHIGEFKGFPAPREDTQLFLAEQVADWVRARYGIVPSSKIGLTDLVMERALRGARSRASSGS